MIKELSVSPEALKYLIAQRGALDDMKGDGATWLRKYNEVVFDEFRAIEPFLPQACSSILDIGSGMGGIDALLNDHYGGDVHVTLLDGVEDTPRVTAHSSTFNHMGVARHFLKTNGVRHMDFIDANDSNRFPRQHYDLIVSFKSWCFHIEPQRHMHVAVAASRPGETVMILDARRGKPEWTAELSEHFKLDRVIGSFVKFDMLRYIAR